MSGLRTFECGTLIDGLGTDPIRDAGLVVEDGRIRAVGPLEELTLPAEATHVDYSGEVVLPGLIDAHVHLLGTESTEPFDAVTTKTPVKVARAIADLRRMLESGFTTVRDMGSDIGIGLGEAVAEGLVEGPRIHSSGRRFSQTAGHGDVHSLPSDWVSGDQAPTVSTLVDGPDQCREAARERIREGADLLKVMTTGGVLSELDRPSQTHFTPAEVRAFVEEAHRFGLPVGCHASGTDGITMAVENGVDTIEHGTYLTEAAVDLLVEEEVPVVTTATPMHRFIEHGPEFGLPDHAVETAREVNEAHLASMRRAHEAGVTLAAGSDLMGTGVLPHGEGVLELERLVDAVGMDEPAALRAATGNAARAVDDGDVGALEPGRLADLLVVDGDPTADVSALRDPAAVYRGGRAVGDPDRAR